MNLSPQGKASLCLLLAAAAITALYWLPSRRATPASITPPPPTAPVTIATASPRPAMLDPDHVVLRPLAVARSSRSHQWTAANAMDPEVIKDIAHNPDEFIRMIEENDRIKRRQLVYRNETVPMLLQRVGGDAASLRSLMLPALDGREVEIEVTGTQLLEGLRSGTVTGRVKGRFNSMATVGFYNGCESFNIISPDDGLYLIADAREPGEVFLKEIDPDRYAPLPCGSNAVTQASH